MPASPAVAKALSREGGIDSKSTVPCALQRQNALLGSRLQRDRQPEAKQDQQPVSD